MPMLVEDYLQKITTDYQLNINNFCIYQGKLEDILFTPPQAPVANDSLVQ
jgi:hypothetical protein